MRILITGMIEDREDPAKTAARENSRNTLILALGCVRDTAFEPQENIVVREVTPTAFHPLVLDGEFEHLFGLSAVLMAVWRFGIAVVP